MKSIYGLLLLMIGLMFASFATFAQEVAPVMPTDDFLKLFIDSLGGLKGASVLGIVLIVLKLLFSFLNSELAGSLGFMRKMDPALKLFIIMVISYATGVITLISVNGLSVGAALIHSTSMTSLIVLLNQGYKKFIEKKI